MKASDIMTLGAATIKRDASLSQALRIMIDHRISALPVLDDNHQVVGIVTEGDFMRSGALAVEELLSMEADDRTKALESRTVDEIMSRDPITINSEGSIQEVVSLMERHTIRIIPVSSNGRTIGIISRVDLLRMLIE
jgi:CBS domain-containing protein